MRHIDIQNRTRLLGSPLRAGVAESFGAKLRGLMFRRTLAAGEGLLLVEPAESRAGASIHMLGMRFDLCIVWLDSDLQVVDLQIARRWRSVLLPAKPARYVLECSPSRYAEFQIGDQIEFKDV
ncbi:MAG: DUF192 domain-containing protein [Anaerolineales bacterium]|nr:DUF192 domain-containing protein [Anaerolineales bacterium]